MKSNFLWDNLYILLFFWTKLTPLSSKLVLDFRCDASLQSYLHAKLTKNGACQYSSNYVRFAACISGASL